MELLSKQEKEDLIFLLQDELKYDGPLWYRSPFTIRGSDETYCLMITDFKNHGDWLIYVSDKPEYNYMLCSNDFGAKFAVNHTVLEYLRELVN